MSIRYLFLFLLINSIAFANDKSFYDGRSKFIQEYIDELTKYQKEDPNYRGAVVESLRGSFFAAFNTKSQSEVDQQALDICIRKKGTKCKVRFQSLSINSSYNRLAQYDSNKKILDVGMYEIPSVLLNTYKGITFVRSASNFKEKDFSCEKNTLNYDFVVDMINSKIDLYPQSFLRKAGLNYVMICDDILANASHPEGLAPSHYDQSPGVFFLSLKKIKKQIDSGQSNIIKHIFHHEFYHIIDSTLTKAVVDEEWVKLNRNPYSNENLKANFQKILADQKGFVSNYAKNNEFEDKAEVFAYLITKHQEMKKILPQDRILYNKTKLIIQRMKSLSSEINRNFWSKL
jgi:hypothetical protein